MGRGYVSGLLIGALFSTVSAAAVSLMLPPLAPLRMPASPEPVAALPEAVSAPEAVAEAETPVMPSSPAAEVTPEASEPVALSEEPATVVDPAAPPAAEETPVAPDAAETAMAAPEPDGVPAPVAEVAPEPTPEPMTETAMAGVTPETPVVDVPAGSEFNRPKPETDPVVPAQQPAPVASAAPPVSAPEAEAEPVLTELAPAAPPEAQGEAPAILPEPAPTAPMSMAEAPAPDSAIPVPPPGESLPPPLIPARPEGEAPAPVAEPAPVEEAAVTPEPVTVAPDAQPAPEPATAPVADPAPEPATAPVEEAAVAPEIILEPAPDPVTDPAPQPERAKLPQIIAPDVNADSAAPEETAVLTPVDEGAANRPRILTPGNAAPSDGGPVIIDVAPQQPIGATARPQVGFGQRGGVQINRLPRIGDDSAAAAPEADATPAESGADQTADTAVSRYRASFDNPDDKPLIAVILIDDGSAATAEPDAIAGIGAPVTIALNPENADAASLAQTFRLSGDEIAIYEPPAPPGATASDREVSYQAYVQNLPETVALVAAPGSALQGDRRAAEHMSALLAAEGRGLVTEARGLNPGRQAAGRANAPYAGIARSLDDGGADDQALQRFLDRAAFDAARSGSIVLIGHATPEVVSALTGWVAAGKKEAVIGPVSAVLAP